MFLDSLSPNVVLVIPAALAAQLFVRCPSSSQKVDTPFVANYFTQRGVEMTMKKETSIRMHFAAKR